MIELRIHKKDLECGSNSFGLSKESELVSEITCKKCLRLIADDGPSKLYAISFNYTEVKYIEGVTSSKAVYKCFKEYYYDDEGGDNIGEQFLHFRKDWRPRARLADIGCQRTLTYTEKHQIEIDKANAFMDDWNKKYPVGTKIWFQGDGKDTPILTKTRSAALNRSGTYCVIFIDDVSGSYHLDERWVRPYLESNKNIESLR